MSRESVGGRLPIGILSITKGVHKGFKPSDSHLTRIFHTQPAGSRIAWIGKKGKAGISPLLVDARKNIFSDNHLPPQLNPLDTQLTKRCTQRNGVQHTRIGGNFFPLTSIAAGGSAYQQVVLIYQSDGTTVKLGLYGVCNGFGQWHIEHPLQLLVKVFQITQIVAVAKR